MVQSCTQNYVSLYCGISQWLFFGPNEMSDDFVLRARQSSASSNAPRFKFKSKRQRRIIRVVFTTPNHTPSLHHSSALKTEQQATKLVCRFFLSNQPTTFYILRVQSSCLLMVFNACQANDLLPNGQDPPEVDGRNFKMNMSEDHRHVIQVVLSL